jgi:glycosyltransferase involved in cell wall biosynthesis
MVPLFVTNICNSKATASHILGKSIVIPNAYDDVVFIADSAVPRDLDLAFVGRLVSEKGVHVLLAALELLATRGIRARTTIIGEGPEAEALLRDVGCRGLGKSVRFAGALRGAAIASELNRHRILVVPSICEESFGIVALEAIACGCVVIGTDGGGLPEAIGPCGLVVARGDSGALADAIGCALLDDHLTAMYRSNAIEHLSRHKAEHVIDRYLAVIERRVDR